MGLNRQGCKRFQTGLDRRLAAQLATHSFTDWPSLDQVVVNLPVLCALRFGAEPKFNQHK
jgi:hypothetical protein